MTLHLVTTGPQPPRVLDDVARRHILTLWVAKLNTDTIAGLTGFTEAQVYNVIARSKGRVECRGGAS